ncbi:MAG: CBS domain-containing protein [Salinisphaera sp.]|nr:CBS domain-containing protein [Salinisphaera sp.]
MDANAILRAKGAHVVTMPPTAQVMETIQLFKREVFGAVVVVDEENRILGVVSERNIILGLAKHGAGLLQMSISTLLGDEFLTCHGNDHVKKLMADMVLHRTRHLPVVDDYGKLCGIISIGDVLNSRMQETELEAGVLRDAYMAHGVSSGH